MGDSKDLVPLTRRGIPIARMRHVYRVDEVGRKLDKLPPKEHEGLRATYERMIEKGSERFQVKPSGLPAMEHLYDDLPNFTDVLDDVRRQLALCEDSRDALEITPLLLLGPPGPGKVFETLVDGQYANPVMVVDEIDKAGGEHAYDPLGALYSLLEHDTAQTFTDEFAEIAIDASQVIWVATANDARNIPEPILNRMNVYEVQAPDHDAARHIAAKLYRSIRADHDWGSRFEPEPRTDVLDRMSEMAPRDMRRAWMTAFGNAKLDRRQQIEPGDLPDTAHRRSTIGFVQ